MSYFYFIHQLHGLNNAKNLSLLHFISNLKRVNKLRTQCKLLSGKMNNSKTVSWETRYLTRVGVFRSLFSLRSELQTVETDP